MSRSFPLDHFDIWFRYYLRRTGWSRQEYADLVGVDIKTIDGICDGSLQPTSKILNEMGVSIKTARLDVCYWSIKID